MSQLQFSTVDLTIVIVYLVFVIALGLRFAKKQPVPKITF